VLRRERDQNWVVVKYEELLANPGRVISGLYHHAGLSEIPEQALSLPENRVRDFSFIKYELMRHPYRTEIHALISERARAMGYNPRKSALPGSGLRYAAQIWLNEHWPQAKRRKLRAKPPLYAAA
jgi:hypothetical protein